MALCVQVNQFGEIAEDTVNCDYSILDASEYADYLAYTTNAVSLADVFEIPESTELASAFELGFGLVMICYLSSWALGAVVNWFNPDHDRY